MDKDGAILEGKIDDVGSPVGDIFRFILPVLSPASWLVARQEENAMNGFELTKGFFKKGNPVNNYDHGRHES